MKMKQRTHFEAENGAKLAQMVLAQFQTKDPFELAARAGVRLSYAHWYPVTWGEYDVRRASICLNTAAPIPLTEVLIHELGHYFNRKAIGNRAEQETIAQEFALAWRRL